MNRSVIDQCYIERLNVGQNHRKAKPAAIFSYRFSDEGGGRGAGKYLFHGG